MIVRALAALLLLLPLAAGCAGGAQGPVTLTVLAETSLTEVLPDLTTVYHRLRPDVRFRLELAGTPDLMDDLKTGDVIITEDAEALQPLRGRLGPLRDVARNSLTIAVTPGNPRHIRSLSSLADRRLRVVLGASTGPLGRYSQQALANAGVMVKPRSEEAGDRTVLSLVRNGEADAGLVYITDMKWAGAAASSVAIPAAENATAVYPAAAISSSRHAREAASFVDWLVTPEATALFNKYGFQSP